MVRDQAGTANQKQVCGAGGYTEISGEETVESTSTESQRPQANKPTGAFHQIIGDQSGYLLSTAKEYNTVTASYWGVMPSYNPQQTLL